MSWFSSIELLGRFQNPSFAFLSSLHPQQQSFHTATEQEKSEDPTSGKTLKMYELWCFKEKCKTWKTSYFIIGYSVFVPRKVKNVMKQRETSLSLFMRIPADGDLSPLHFTSLPSASVGCIAFTFSYHATCILYMQNATHILLQHI